MKLKTLKDLPLVNRGGEIEILRMEAIYWLTELKFNPTDERFFDSDSNSNQILLNWIKHFFNISEKDLKGGIK